MKMIARLITALAMMALAVVVFVIALVSGWAEVASRGTRRLHPLERLWAYSTEVWLFRHLLATKHSATRNSLKNHLAAIAIPAGSRYERQTLTSWTRLRQAITYYTGFGATFTVLTPRGDTGI